MSASAIEGVLVSLFDKFHVEAYGRASDRRFEVCVRRGRATEDLCFALFQRAVDELVVRELVDPTREVVLWIGLVDVVPRGFLRLGRAHA
jgi:hypothetical protein